MPYGTMSNDTRKMLHEDGWSDDYIDLFMDPGDDTETLFSVIIDGALDEEFHVVNKIVVSWGWMLHEYFQSHPSTEFHTWEIMLSDGNGDTLAQWSGGDQDALDREINALRKANEMVPWWKRFAKALSRVPVK